MPKRLKIQLPTPLRSGLGPRLRGVLPDLPRPGQSLPSRLALSVFGAMLVSSLAVTWISTHSTEAFLRRKIDAKFPAILRSTGERLDLWYAQRQLDIETFARSASVVQGLAGGAGAAGPLDQMHKYLAYVLQRFGQYEALFVLDAQGEEVLWEGVATALPPELREPLVGLRGPLVSPALELADRRVQVMSSPVLGADGERLGSLHGLVPIEAVEELMRSDDVGPGGEIYALGPEGGVLTRPRAGNRAAGPARRLAADAVEPVVAEYADAAGRRVVGGALRFARFGWTLVVEEPYEQAFAPVVTAIRKVLAINLAVVAVFGLATYQIARSTVRPILALSGAARRFAQGASDVRIPHSERRDEIGVLTRAFQEMTGRLNANQRELERKQLEIEDANERLRAQNFELQRANEKLGQLSITDGLTRLHNHRHFQDQLRREIKRAARAGDPLALLLIDVDDFKQLNDRFGHAAGDTVLRRVGHVVANLVRDTDLPARYGGEEFAVIAPHTGPEGAVALAEKLRMAISLARFALEDESGPVSHQVTASIGVGIYRENEKQLFRDADRALYRAKDEGKDCVMSAEEL